MGNRASRQKAESKGAANLTKVDGAPPASQSIKTSSVDPPSADENKGVSCPDLSAGAVAYRDDGAAATVSPPGQRQLNYTVYRSYSNVAEASRRPEPRPDIRVYRRNTAARYGTRRYGGDPAERSQTLPRGFGRSRSAMSGLQTTGMTTVSGTGDTSTLPRGRFVTSGQLKRQTALGLSASGGLGQLDARPAKRTSSTVSMTSIGYRVTADDMPDTGTIKRRLAQFETVFARALAKLYTSLPESVQLSTLSVAIRPDRANQHISLWQYLNSPEVPLDLLADGGDVDGGGYVLTIQPALFGGLMHVRRDRGDDRAAAASLAGELVACLAAEAGAELARIFEYQIALLSDGLTIELVAGHAARCVLDYLKTTGRPLDRNTIVLGAVRGEHVLESTSVTPKLSVVIGQRELKWEIGEIFKKPGLRKELFLFSDDIEVNESEPPWRFFASYYHDPMLYGYRGLIIEWDYVTAADCACPAAGGPAAATTAYRLNGEDESSFTDEVDYRPDDFHRHYCPYRRLVGAGVVDRYQRASTCAPEDSVEMRAASSLAEFVRRLHGQVYGRDQIQPIYRPVAEPPPTDDAGLNSDDEQTGTGSRDDRYAMVDERERVQRPLVVSEHPTLTNVAGIVSNPLPVVQEASSEDPTNGNGDQEPASHGPTMNGGSHVTGNGDVDHCVGKIEVADDIIKPTTTTVVTQMTIVRHVNGDAVGMPNSLPVEVTVEESVGDDSMAAVNGTVCAAELANDGVGPAVTATSGHIIDEANRRTIRSDL